MTKNSGKWTESDVFEMLYHAWPSPSHVRLPQVRNGTGYARGRTRTADAIVASVWPSQGLSLTGVEIKVTRADWQKELKDPAKSDEIGKYCKRWYIAAPKGLIAKAEIPDAWGLVEVTRKTAKIVKRGPDRDCIPPDMLLVCSLLRAVDAVCVPRSGLNRRVEEAVKSQRKIWAGGTDRRYDALQACVNAFERSTGLHVASHWEHGNIKKVVELLAESQSVIDIVAQVKTRLKLAAESAMLAVKPAEQLLQQLEEAEKEATT